MSPLAPQVLLILWNSLPVGRVHSENAANLPLNCPAGRNAITAFHKPHCAPSDTLRSTDAATNSVALNVKLRGMQELATLSTRHPQQSWRVCRGCGESPLQVHHTIPRFTWWVQVPPNLSAKLAAKFVGNGTHTAATKSSSRIVCVGTQGTIPHKASSLAPHQRPRAAYEQVRTCTCSLQKKHCSLGARDQKKSHLSKRKGTPRPPASDTPAWLRNHWR